MEQCISTGKLPKKRNFPWASRNIKRFKERLCIQEIQKNSLNIDNWEKKVVHELRRARKSYVNNIIRAKNPKQFWAAIKALNRNNSSCIPTLSCLSQMIKGKLRSYIHSSIVDLTLH